MRTPAILFLCAGLLAAADVLIVADEIPAMQTLAAKLEAGAGVRTTIVPQTELPPEPARYSAIVVYIHRNLGQPAEKAFIDYARGGGKLILLHHSISSAKRANPDWFPFLGISLPTGDVSQGGYKYYAPVTMEFVNLAPKHAITTRNIRYPEKVAYKSSDADGPEKSVPGFALTETEVYLNHVLTSPKTVLLGVKFTDKDGKTYMQDRAGWYEKTGRGLVFYFMAGHSGKDFENPVYAQILVNAVLFQP
jgi:trehalose utilization protein